MPKVELGYLGKALGLPVVQQGRCTAEGTNQQLQKHDDPINITKFSFTGIHIYVIILAGGRVTAFEVVCCSSRARSNHCSSRGSPTPSPSAASAFVSEAEGERAESAAGPEIELI